MPTGLWTVTALWAAGACAASAQQPCRLRAPADSLIIPYVNRVGLPSADPTAPQWTKAGSTRLRHDCTRIIDYPDLETEVRAFWSDTHVYFLFAVPYRKLNLFLPAQGVGDRDKLWDRDVVEIFLGADQNNINRYREFEIAPTGDHVDLNIEYDRKRYDQSWNSGWETAARIDEPAHRWYAAARIPLSAISADPVKPGTRWRVNLYRIDGEGPDRDRRFLCWRSTCVINRDPNHVPEAFGALVFGR
ncbi:MAG: carbohydrate-binding family 9-like protein [Gemmatimonadetes bacterium]|nr:carbohydrate-binding family 9-like protein [Gemmatimonadota bacterium]